MATKKGIRNNGASAFKHAELLGKIGKSITPILNKQNKITRYVALGSDITRLKLSEEEIVTQNAIIAKKNKEITSSIRYTKRIQDIG